MKLTQLVIDVVWKTGQDFTPETLFLAMLPIIMVAYTSADVSNYTFWTSIPHPPLNRHTILWDPSIPVYVNDST